MPGKPFFSTEILFANGEEFEGRDLFFLCRGGLLAVFPDARHAKSVRLHFWHKHGDWRRPVRWETRGSWDIISGVVVDGFTISLSFAQNRLMQDHSFPLEFYVSIDIDPEPEECQS